MSREYKIITDQEVLRQDLIKRVAEDTGLPVRVVEKIVMFQYKEVRDCARTCNTIDITGLGMIKISKPITLRQLTSLRLKRWRIKNVLDNPEKCQKLTERRKHSHQTKLAELEGKINYLEERLRIYESRL